MWGRGEGTLLEKGSLSPSKPPPLPPKTFDFIESPLSILLDKKAFLRMGEGSFIIF